MTHVIVILGILLAVILSAVFSGAEMALSSANTVRLENEAKAGSRKSARALKLAENYDDTLSAILVGNNLVNTAASSLTTVLIILLTGSDRLNWAGTLVVTILVIIFGETIPKIICKKLSTKVSAEVSGFIRFVYILFFPVNFLVAGLVGLLTRSIRETPEEEDESVEELQSIIETAEDEGVLDSERSELISAAIDFQEISADEVMTARVDMEAIDIDDDFENILKLAVESTHSRLPVYEGSIDNVIGVVHMNHLLKALSEDRDADIREVMLKPCFVYRKTKLPQVLNTLKRVRQHLAIVTDEYSGTLGVISMEDVLEQIVGEIWDETDEVEEEVVARPDGELEIDGDMVIGDFLELFGIDEEQFEYESRTVGGFVTEFRGEFPEPGYTFRYENLVIRVLEMDGRRVEKLLVTKVPDDPE
ncbi:MAG: HlyC/CorC family transporter [Lachnospiraceae bacterium]|nr:HlyC/CorC family transporter [Lachnospiraceae bacterium]